MLWLKLLPKILLGFKDVSETYKAETGQGRPWYYSRTFMFSALCFIASIVAVVTGITIDPAIINVVADNLPVLITSVVALVGAVMSFIAQWKSQKNPTPNDTSSNSTQSGVSP